MTFKKDLKDLKFPVVLKLCIQEIENIHDRYRKIGYYMDKELFSGKSRFSNTTYGCNGHNINQTSLFSTVNGKYVVNLRIGCPHIEVIFSRPQHLLPLGSLVLFQMTIFRYISVPVPVSQ